MMARSAPPTMNCSAMEKDLNMPSMAAAAALAAWPAAAPAWLAAAPADSLGRAGGGVWGADGV